jgi:hypothetical protein
MTWFETLTGIPKETPDQVRRNITLEGDQMRSRGNGRVMTFGRLEIPSLAELRDRLRAQEQAGGQMTVREVVANVQHLHADASNTGALFQVASQFNLLEMVDPRVTPEEGVGIYEHDHTQGPACAIAAGAGTIYRNYFVPIRGQTGQSAANQIDCLSDLGAALGNSRGYLWEMRNGYALASQSGLIEIGQRLRTAPESELYRLRGLLRIGIQWDTQVTLGDSRHTVSQAYCSALPVAYSGHAPHLWEPFARLILEAAYEAMFCAAILNAARGISNRLYLTLLGGGAYGNETDWILSALARALHLHRHANLDVAVVSYGSSNPRVRELAG